MQISWYGQSCFKLISGDLTVVVSPFGTATGLPMVRGRADIVLFSDDDARRDALKSLDAGFVIAGAGEYEVRGVGVSGFTFFHPAPKGKGMPKKSTAYLIRMDGMTLCHLDSISKEEAERLLEHMGGVDILMVPVGGKHQSGASELAALDAEGAVSVIGEIEPRVTIPMLYKIPKLTFALEGLPAFVKAMGGPAVEPVEKFTVKKKDLPQEETRLVVCASPT
ncbi:MAG: MBL fold metallo-hydrolase [Patescibacteria group bacterium]